MFAYTADEAYVAVGELDSNQREVYILGIWVLDMPYIGIYGLFFSAILFRIWKSSRTASLPAMIMIADFFENVAVSGLLKLYPVRNEVLANAASFFTTVKWILVGALLVTLVAGLFSVVASRKHIIINSSATRI